MLTSKLAVCLAFASGHRGCRENRGSCLASGRAPEMRHRARGKRKVGETVARGTSRRRRVRVRVRVRAERCVERRGERCVERWGEPAQRRLS